MRPHCLQWAMTAAAAEASQTAQNISAEIDPYKPNRPSLVLRDKNPAVTPKNCKDKNIATVAGTSGNGQPPLGHG